MIRAFIDRKTKDTPSNELIILCGDINVNGSIVDRKGQTYRELVKEKVNLNINYIQPEFKVALDIYDKEYNNMIDIFSNKQEDQIIDVMRISNNGHSPVTFGDCFIDDHGVEHPMDQELVKVEDYCTQ